MSAAAKIILLAGAGGALWWGAKKGYLSALLGGSVSPGGGSSQAGGKPPFWPSSSPADIPLNQWEAILVREAANCSEWSKANRKWTAAIMKVESGYQGSAARGSAGEIGLMQVKPDTAAQMYANGYTHFIPNEATLATDAGGVYFGTAYLEYLSRIHPQRDWITKAYNGGPGFEGLGDAYVKAREQYLNEVTKTYENLYPNGRSA